MTMINFNRSPEDVLEKNGRMELELYPVLTDDLKTNQVYEIKNSADFEGVL
jgi:hypothetical protein